MTNQLPSRVILAASTRNELPLDFEQKLANCFETIQSQLNSMQESLNSLPDLLTSELRRFTGFDRDGMSAASQSIALQPTPWPQVPLSDSQDIQLRQLQEDNGNLSAENAALLEEKLVLERSMLSLQAEQQKKSREVKRLNEIIIQTGQHDEYVTDDEINKKFGALAQAILSVVMGHFSKSRPSLFLNTSNKPAQHDFVLSIRAKVASSLFKGFFGPEIYLFGLDIRQEEAQGGLELKLREQGVPEPQVTDWRIALIKAAVKADLKEKHDFAAQIAKKLFNQLWDECVITDNEKSYRNLEQVCIDAWSLALLLRTSRSVYEWQQDCKLDQVQRADVDFTDQYKPRDGRAPMLPMRILFGPLYKVVEGQKVLLRRGEVLRGN